MDYKELLKSPIFFKPNRVWRCYIGGSLMDTYMGKEEHVDGHFPEDWLGSTTIAINGVNQQHPYEGLSRIKMLDGKTDLFFRDILQQNPKEALGREVFTNDEGLGVLCKFLDSAIRLPIQCHPDVHFAQQYYNSNHGKTESWFILGTRKINNENPYILMGFKKNVDPEKFKEFVRQENIIEMEQSLHRVEVAVGQMYFIPGRMPHAIGPGVFLLEVQEPTDWVIQPERFIGDTELTYSNMWGPLEPEIGLNCFDYDSKGSKNDMLKKVSLKPIKSEMIEGGMIEQIIGPNITQCFSVDRLTVVDTADINFEKQWYLAVVVKGTSILRSESKEVQVKQGDCFFISTILSKLRFNPVNEPLQIYLISKDSK